MSRNSDWVAGLKQPITLLRALIVALLAVNLVMAVVAFKPFGGSADDLRRNEAGLRDRLAATQARLAIGRRLADKVETARHQGDQFLTRYVVDRRTASSAVYEELTRMAAEAGIQPGQESFEYDEIEGSVTLQMMTISAGFEGTYPQITKFVNLVDKSPRFFVIESMQTAAPQNGQKLSIQLKIDAFIRGAAEGVL